MIRDFQTFYYRLLLSLTPDVPLEENLRSLVAPTLGKLKRYTGAAVTVHCFANPVVGELHAMAVGASRKTAESLRAEAAYRHQHEGADKGHRPNLPAYGRFELPEDAKLDAVFDHSDPVPRELSGKEVRWLLDPLAKRFADEFDGVQPGDGDRVIVVALGTGEYGRLGSFLMWIPAGKSQETGSLRVRLEELMAFRKTFEQVLIRVFTNLYGMVPSTYLPSYHQAGAKPATLLCAEIREFDRVCEILRQRVDFDGDRAAVCLAQLVQRFTRSAADIVEGQQGRVDQTWGSGILCVFGEHVAAGTVEGASIGCMRALTAAAEFVTAFEAASKSWLRDDFDIISYTSSQAADIRVEAAVLVDYGNVLFEYVGSSRHQSYMTVGDRVDLAKSLLTAADRHAVEDGPGVAERPIILSQAAYHWCRNMLKDVHPDPAGYLASPHLITLAGKPTRYPVHYVRPANIVTRAS